MRILIATDAFPPKCGGSGWSTFYLARAMQARGHQIEVIQPQCGAHGIQTRTYENLAVTEFGYTASNMPGVRAWQRTIALDRQFTAFLTKRARRADVIHAQHLLTIPPAVRAGHVAQVPVVSTVRDYWPVCLYGTLWRDGGICSICRGRALTRCLKQKYGPVAALAYPFLPLAQHELARRQHALRESHAVVAVSHFVAEKLRDTVGTARLFVIPNLLDIDETQRLATHENTSHAPYLLFIGKLNLLKGADLLPEILRRARAQMKLRVVGNGTLTATLAREPSIELCGWLPNQKALQLLANARALLFPARWAEPLARTLLEAQALGTPTVALDTGGTRDIIQTEVNGLLARDVSEFAVQLTRLLSDQALYARLRTSAQRIAVEKFSADVVAPQIEAVYQSY